MLRSITTRHPAGFLAVLFAAALLQPIAVQADCPGDLQGTDGALGRQLDQDPAGTIPKLKALLLQDATHAALPISPAHIDALLADGYWSVGDVTAARAAAAQGLAALNASDSEGLHRRLQLKAILLRGEQGELVTATREYDAAAAQVPEDAPDLACVLIDRGYLRYRMGRMSEAASDLIRAYQLAGEHGSIANRMLAATVLSMLYSKNGFREEALDYTREIIDYDEKSGNRRWLADGYYLRGDVSLGLGDLAAAETDFKRALVLWKQVGFPLDVETAQHSLCATFARIPNRADAREVCREAYRMAVAVEDPEIAKTVLGMLGQIEFNDGHPKEAIGLLNQALANDGIDINKPIEAGFYGLRGQVRAQLGDAVGALQDTNVYLHWLQNNLLVRNVGQIAVTRAKYEAAINEQQLGRVRAESTSAKLASSRQLLEMNLIVLVLALLFSTALLGTWVRRRRQETERVAQAAEERLAAMGQVTGGIAHDFNNQLTVLQQATWLLSSHPAVAADARARELLTDIRQSGVACAEITAQMLSFARQQNLKPEPVALEQFLTTLRPTFETLAGSSITIKFELGSPPPVAMVDERQLTAALLNLVGNARDAMPEGGTLWMRAQQSDGQCVQISVVDSGCGMSPEVLARAIEPFYSTKPVGRGSGLGLSMVQGFATQSGGSLSVSSVPNVGTTVLLTLPAVRVSA
jgi:signal transduction histidine kinase